VHSCHTIPFGDIECSSCIVDSCDIVLSSCIVKSCDIVCPSANEKQCHPESLHGVSISILYIFCRDRLMDSMHECSVDTFTLI
jgi:hypothetical protein